MDLHEVAKLEESRIARAMQELALVSRPFAGGVAARGEPGSWLNQAVGAGMNGEVRSAELRDLVEWYTGAGIEPRLEVAPFVDPSLLAVAAELGFTLRLFENVFFRVLIPGETVTPLQPTPPDLVIEEVPRDSESAAREFTMVAMSGFLAAGQSPSEEDFAIMSRQINHPRSISLVARRGGVAVAACGMEMSSGVAALFGLSVLPEQRRQGIQQALLAWRLNYASKNGARVATIGSRPGVATERNVRRMGFEVAYTKVVVALYGPGLVPVRFT